MAPLQQKEAQGQECGPDNTVADNLPGGNDLQRFPVKGKDAPHSVSGQGSHQADPPVSYLLCTVHYSGHARECGEDGKERNVTEHGNHQLATEIDSSNKIVLIFILLRNYKNFVYYYFNILSKGTFFSSHRFSFVASTSLDVIKVSADHLHGEPV
jgi:hypothetical protein